MATKTGCQFQQLLMHLTKHWRVNYIFGVSSCISVDRNRNRLVRVPALSSIPYLRGFNSPSRPSILTENLCEFSRALEVHYVIGPQCRSQTHSFRFILWSELAVNKFYSRIYVFEQLSLHLKFNTHICLWIQQKNLGVCWSTKFSKKNSPKKLTVF